MGGVWPWTFVSEGEEAGRGSKGKKASPLAGACGSVGEVLRRRDLGKGPGCQ